MPARHSPVNPSSPNGPGSQASRADARPLPGALELPEALRKSQAALASQAPLAVVALLAPGTPELLRWLAFHRAVGVQRFYLYLQDGPDGSLARLQALAQVWPITPHAVWAGRSAQLSVCQHAWDTYGDRVGWMAFLEPDELLLPARAEDLAEALSRYAGKPVSAIGVGAQRPAGGGGGLRSIVRGAEPGVRVAHPHRFHTPRGTVDERGQPLGLLASGAAVPPGDWLAVQPLAEPGPAAVRFVAAAERHLAELQLIELQGRASVQATQGTQAVPCGETARMAPAGVQPAAAALPDAAGRTTRP